jgi:hypothetical protein
MRSRPMRPWLVIAPVAAVILAMAAFVLIDPLDVRAPVRTPPSNAAPSSTRDSVPVSSAELPDGLTAGDGATPADVELVAWLLAFVADPSAESAAHGRFAADGVRLGLADIVSEPIPVAELGDRARWVMHAEEFRGYAGPFSALETLAQWRTNAGGPPVEELVVTVGDHPHCASAPVPPPNEVEDFQRVSVQPVGIDSCIQWWTVDLFVTDDGGIAAVTLDRYEP